MGVPCHRCCHAPVPPLSDPVLFAGVSGALGRRVLLTVPTVSRVELWTLDSELGRARRPLGNGTTRIGIIDIESTFGLR